ncbi:MULTISPECIES: endonuclease/exonuclease/phosphatase family protein [Flavobacteriaceae]|uniref:endonuclease/exonuclease/phosphatase family protein n=1 Tax=Flavobacteriaceae TaxID=49546 RepID=UPI00234AE282|nr:endonuclease/exonuclease/phosphatase family protein [Muricauda sp. SP22]MDC6362103.1 endonuclease/exonuclease/phosphatase family protein [Muricauda sp. SP22]
MKLRKLLCLIALLICSTMTGQTNAANNPVVRVLTFNILHGATTKGDFNLDVLAKVIQDAKPDFVALQEVDFMTNRAKKYDLVTELGWRTKLVPLFGKAMSYDDGEYGEGILSKYSFINTRNVALPHSPQNEPRAALEVVTMLPSGDTIAFVGTHLDHLKDVTDRIAQTKHVNTTFSQNRYPTILAGDLNDVPGSIPISILEEVWNASYDKNNIAPTYPSDHPTKKIDYVMFLPKNRWKILETKVIQDTVASDHCAYLVTLELLDLK